MKINERNNAPKGITLIALVITIIILLILAGITISSLMGENGVLKKAENSTEENRKQTATEKMNLKITNIQIETYGKKQKMPSLQELADGLCEDEADEIEYVFTESQAKQASLDKIEVREATSIFTKLREYPYEFEINRNLQLASIDGIKVAEKEENVTIPKEEYESLKNKVESLTTVQTYDKTAVEINADYFDVENSTFQISKVGNIVNIYFSLKPKRNITANTEPEAFLILASNLPIPKNKFVIFIGRTDEAQKIEMVIYQTNQLHLYWPNVVINSGKVIHGSATYICQE